MFFFCSRNANCVLMCMCTYQCKQRITGHELVWLSAHGACVCEWVWKYEGMIYDWGDMKGRKERVCRNRRCCFCRYDWLMRVLSLVSTRAVWMLLVLVPCTVCKLNYRIAPYANRCGVLNALTQLPNTRQRWVVTMRIGSTATEAMIVRW